MSRFSRSAAVVTGFTALGIVLSLGNHLVIAAVFGAGATMDAYLAAITLPTLLTAVLTGTLAATFLPAYTEARERDPAEARRLAGTYLHLAVGAALLLALAAALFAPGLVRLLAPGLSQTQQRLSATLLRWLLPGLALSAFNEAASALHYARGNFRAPMLLRVIAPVTSVAGVLAFAPKMGVGSLVLASLGATFLHSVLLAARLWRDGSRYPRPHALTHPAVRRIAILVAPMALTLSVSRLIPTIDRWFASSMETGSISLLGYANRLMLVIQPVLTTGISLSGFVLMSGLAARRDFTGLRDSMARSFRMLLFLGLPTAVLLSAFARPLVSLALARGAFPHEAAQATADLFALYVLSLPVTAAGTVIAQGFYVLQDTRTPLLVGLVEVALYFLLCTLLIPVMGLRALPVSFLVYFHFSVLVLALLLSQRTGFPVLGLLAKPLLQGLLAAGVAWLAGRGLAALLPTAVWGDWGAVPALALAFVVYFAVQKVVFRSPEISTLRRLMVKISNRIPHRNSEAMP